MLGARCSVPGARGAGNRPARRPREAPSGNRTCRDWGETGGRAPDTPPQQARRTPVNPLEAWRAAGRRGLEPRRPSPRAVQAPATRAGLYSEARELEATESPRLPPSARRGEGAFALLERPPLGSPFAQKLSATVQARSP